MFFVQSVKVKVEVEALLLIEFPFAPSVGDLCILSDAVNLKACSTRGAKEALWLKTQADHFSSG